VDRFEITWPGSKGKGKGASSPEESRLDGLLCRPDPLLTASLREEESHRRRQRLWRVPVFLLLALAIVFTSSTWVSPARLPHGYRSSGSARAEAALLVEQAQKLAYAGEWDKAHTLFSRAVTLAPDLPEPWAEMAVEVWHRYQIEEAETTARRALALDPANLTALELLGEIHLGLGENRKAEKLFSKPGLEANLATLYLLEGRFAEAERLLGPLSRKEPENSQLRRMAEAASSRSLSPELRARLAVSPMSRSQWTALAWRMRWAKQYEEAVSAFERALAESPEDVAAINGMGHSLLELRRAREAEGYFERSLRVAPDNPVALAGLGEAYKAEGRVDEAVRVWESMCRIHPGPHRGTKGLAWTYYERGDYRRAALYLAQLVKRYPNDKTIVQALNISVQKLEAEGSTPESSP
jgi:tetratricopeptide (TPR) repeat protein